MAPMPQLQRRYSVTGLAPPGDVSQVSKQQHSPKLQALDTSVQSTPNCGLCDSGADAAKAAVVQHLEDVEAATTSDDGDRGRKISHQTMGRVVSKRSATQLPSPSTPTTHQLPPKIAKLALESPDMHAGLDLDDDVELDEGVFTDTFSDEGSIGSSPYDAMQLDTLASSPLPVPELLSNQPFTEPFDSDSDSDHDSGVESLALTPIPTSPTSLCAFPPVSLPHPPTFLTLPPEIRHQIYLNLPDLVLSHPLIYCLSTFNNAMQHPLASVNRTIRAEALAIFYSYNTWTIKLEFKMMYEAFRDWIIRLGEGARMLRLVTVAVRGGLFKPGTHHHAAAAAAAVGGNPFTNANGHVTMVPGMPAYALVVEQYCPPDGDACFAIDLSEKHPGGKVSVVRNDGTEEAAERAVGWLSKEVGMLWEKRRVGALNGQDWVDFVDALLAFVGS